MKYVKLFEEFVNEDLLSINKAQHSIDDKLRNISLKKKELTAKLKYLVANSEEPADVDKVKIAKMKVQLLNLEKEKAALTQDILNLKKKTHSKTAKIKYRTA